MRILLVTSDVPVTSAMAGSPRTFSLFRDLANRDDIHLATFRSSNETYDAVISNEETSKVFESITVLPNPRTMSFWGRQRHRLVQAPYFVTRYRSPHEFRFIRSQIIEIIQQRKPDLVFADSLSAAQYILDCHMLPRVVDAVDAISLNFRRGMAYAGSHSQRARSWLESRSVRAFEVATARTVDAYIVCSPIDQETLQSYHRDVKVRCIPNGVDMEYFAPNGERSCERTVVFTGVMGYPPNRDAAHFLCTEILPHLKESIPEVKVDIVGSDPPEDVRALTGNGVTVTGAVPDVRPFVRRAGVYVSPLRFGTGVKNKILAALAMGKAVVATPASCEGLDVTPGEHVLVAENPRDFASLIVRLLADPERRYRLGVAGRRLVVQRYGWGAMGKQLRGLLESLVLKEREVAPDRPFH